MVVVDHTLHAVTRKETVNPSYMYGFQLYLFKPIFFCNKLMNTKVTFNMCHTLVVTQNWLCLRGSRGGMTKILQVYGRIPCHTENIKIHSCYCYTICIYKHNCIVLTNSKCLEVSDILLFPGCWFELLTRNWAPDQTVDLFIMSTQFL